MDDNRNVWSFLAAFALGGIIGAAIMTILAPHSGEETRTMINDRVRMVKSQAAKTVDRTTTRTGSIVEDLRDRVLDTANTFMNRGQIAAETYKSNVEAEAKSKSVQFGR